MRKNSYQYDELLLCAQGKLFEMESARLPLPNMLMFNRIISIDEQGGKYGKGHVTAELDIHPDLWFFDCHFKGDPVMPGCLGLDALWQMAGFYLFWCGYEGKGRAFGVEKVKFSGQILPSHTKAQYHLDIKRVIRRQLTLVVADGEVSIDRQSVATAASLQVGLT